MAGPSRNIFHWRRRRMIGQTMGRYLLLKTRGKFGQSFSITTAKERSRPRGSTTERNLVWLCDMDRALSRLDPLDRQILMGRLLGFTTWEIARALHKTEKAIECRIPRAEQQAAELFLSQDVLETAEAEWLRAAVQCQEFRPEVIQ